MMIKQLGYSLLELMLATAVGAVVIAGGYASYVIVAKQYERIISFSEVHEAGIPAIRLLSRDLRMAGFVALDANLDSTYGTITTPITITDSGDACCDSVQIIYDRSTTNRRSMTYYTLARTNPARNALYLDVAQWDGVSAWTAISSQSLVTDYVEDFQVIGSDNDANGNPQIVDFNLTMRSKTMMPRSITYTRPNEVVGNYTYNFSDRFHRDEFSGTINIKNLRY